MESQRNVHFARLALLMILLSKGGNGAPHIVMVLADDLGWNDVSWHNDYVIMGNISRLASEGVILDQAYAHEICSPSRAALLTGYYPIHNGMHNGIVKAKELNGLSLNFKLLPEYLKEAANYESHIIGKWHLGYCNESYTPIRRGFHSHYGFYNGKIDCYNHTHPKFTNKPALDYRDDFRLNVEATGKYSTEDFTDQAIKVVEEHDASRPMFLYLPYNAIHDPHQVPKYYTDMYPGLKDGDRKTCLGMITALDHQLKRLEDALIAKGIWNDTVFVFYSDNGGSTNPNGSGGNNYPLRGRKQTRWEGGYKIPAFVRSNLLEKTNYVNTRWIHITDLFATFLYLAGGQAAIPAGIDGMNVWGAISRNEPSPRKRMVYNIVNEKGAIRENDFKLIVQKKGNNFHGRWYRPLENRNYDAIGELSADQYGPHQINDKYYYLFNLKDDPYETTNLASSESEKLESMIKAFKEESAKVVDERTRYESKTYDPSQSDPPAWTPGFC